MDAQTILVAVIGAAGLVGQGLAMTRRHMRNLDEKIDTTVGKPNGLGNVVEMQTATLKALGRLEEKLDRHIGDPDAHQ